MHFFLSPGNQLPFSPAGVGTFPARGSSISNRETCFYTPPGSPPMSWAPTGMRLEIPLCRAVRPLGAETRSWEASVNMRISADGFIDLRDKTRVRTPGYHEVKADPMPETEAVAFLLSHSFPGHRRIVRSLTSRERARLRMASWADSISERMSLLDKVWRGITRPVPSPMDPTTPELVQIVRVDGDWAYPIYLDGEETRVLPTGGMPLSELKKKLGAPLLDLSSQKASA